MRLRRGSGRIRPTWSDVSLTQQSYINCKLQKVGAGRNHRDMRVARKQRLHRVDALRCAVRLLEGPVEGTEVQHVGGSEAHPTRQAAPHPHSNFVDPSGGRVLVSDLGQDKIYSYTVDAAAGTLSEHRVIEAAPASGPRHMVFHPSGEFVYGINELDSTINAYR